MERVEFVQRGQMTPAGQDVIAYMERCIKDATALYESSGDLNHLNGMTGALKHYYVNVQQAKVITPENWLESYDYGANAMYRNLLEERKAETDAQREQEQADKTDDLASRLEALEGKLTEALDTIKAKEGEIADLKAKLVEDEDTDAEPEPAPARKRGKAKAKDTEEAEPPAETAAEEDAETEDEDAE